MVVVGVLAGLAVAGVLRGCHRSRLAQFDPTAVASPETAMWKAYYSGDRTRLGIEMVKLLHEQYGVSILSARGIAADRGGAAMTFRGSEEAGQQSVLAQLTKAYDGIKKSARASFDSHAAAEAELAWWVARRTPGENRSDMVGEQIASLYAVLYGRARPAFTKAGILRAEAAAIRDEGGEFADWSRVKDLLQ